MYLKKKKFLNKVFFIYFLWKTEVNMNAEIICRFSNIFYIFISLTKCKRNVIECALRNSHTYVGNIACIH